MFRYIRSSLTHLADWLWQTGIDWLNAIPTDTDFSALCNFEFLEREVRPGDVILFAGQSRVSRVIQTVVLSPWTHAALYVGRLSDIHDPKARARLASFYEGDPNEPLVVESLLGQGTVVNPLRKYRTEHLRICRPAGITWQDADKVTEFAIEHLGMGYDVRQLLDLARFMFPYAILPRRWRSSLFQHNAGQPTHIVCSSMIARCFQSVRYPILPIVRNENNETVRFYERDFRLFTPSDFDYSPYFMVIKYPAWNVGREPAYRTLPWSQEQEVNHVLVTKTASPLPQPTVVALDEKPAASVNDPTPPVAGKGSAWLGLRAIFWASRLVPAARSIHQPTEH